MDARDAAWAMRSKTGAGSGPAIARNAMTPEPVVAREHMSLLDAAGLLRGNGISGAPVTNADERVTGVISEKDVVRALVTATGIVAPWNILDIVVAVGARKGEGLIDRCKDALGRMHVRDFMTAPAITIDGACTLEEAAFILTVRRINRLPVVEDGRLVGVLTRHDIVVSLSDRWRAKQGIGDICAIDGKRDKRL